MNLNKSLAFLGGGVMATAILQSLLDGGLVEPGQVVVSEPVEARREALSRLGVRAVATSREAAAGADVVVLAVKPHVVPDVLREARTSLAQAHLVISIAAGVTLAQLESLAPSGVPVIRVMPNTPVQVGAGAAALCRGTHASEEHAALVRRIFEAGGRCVEVTEAQIDAVTGLSGSGPAYVCLIVEALADGGVRMGLPRDVALTLAAQTVLGSAKLILETGDHPAVLKDRVATPGGTTIAGLAALEEAGVRSGLIKAVEAATRRAAELGKKS
ncbi:MAG: pyrroline-5-carboxylate reductase [Armatimonadetes bacterium]|jgi:pyrroline-5-carboxylate reductase|nr:pyrroline-5-carboxylate reductase [Armatimonadota bacterium]